MQEQESKKEFYLLCKAIKDKSINREMLIAFANSYIESQNLVNSKRIKQQNIDVIGSFD